jgi:D-beta-D-heptose 7-phosphate kinase/D-beta-D-heptose 1-phosphate adenosyltransferase
MRLRERLDGFADTPVLVVGEAMVDAYVSGQADRLSREAPVPIVALESREDAPGGAANAAVNLAALGARPMLASVVGRDAEAERLREALLRRQVGDEHLVTDAGRATLAKLRILAGTQMLVRLDSGSTGPVEADGEDRLIAAIRAAWARAAAVLISDYDYGVLTPRVIEAIGTLAAESPRLLVVDARDPGRYRDLPVTAVKPNYGEAARLLGEAERRGMVARSAHVLEAQDRLLELAGARIVAVTLDRDGVLVLEAGQEPYRTLARPRSDGAAAGAGDTFVAALTLALAARATAPEAAELASLAAGVVMGKAGTAACALPELVAALEVPGKRTTDRGMLVQQIRDHRAQGRRIVFTNGCFDILHRGHVAYLNRAKALGDVLVVAVNGDDSVRRLKGPERPLNPLEDRLQVLEALACVDHVVPFDEDTPHALIRAVRPDVFAKGGDYARDRLAEAALVEALGGSVQILPLVDDRSTTGLIARVRSSDRGRATEPAGTGP